MCDLDELDRLNAARTQGEWLPYGYTHGILANFAEKMHSTPVVVAEDKFEFSEEDVAAVCAAMNALPELLRLARIGQAHDIAKEVAE